MLCPYSKQYPTENNNEYSSCPEENYHVVKAEDTLYTISKLYNISPDNLIEANPNIEPDLIHPGQIIRIPLPTQPANCPIGATTYIIQKGDTFYSIAKRNKMCLSALLEANPNINPDALLIGQTICLPMISCSYINETYKIKFMYPFLWSKFNDERYEGISGFFQVSAISNREDLDKVSDNEAYHKLKPYGSQPTISNATVGNHSACFILPSADQPMEMHGQSAVIAAYDNPIYIKDIGYKYLIIRTDKNHLKDITDTLEFI